MVLLPPLGLKYSQWSGLQYFEHSRQDVTVNEEVHVMLHQGRPLTWRGESKSLRAGKNAYRLSAYEPDP
jgi:hypothetical protein